MMTLENYESLLAAKHETMSPQEFEKFLVSEVLECMRVSVGIIAENTELKRKLSKYEQGASPP